ncbi:MAG: energy transducer TonB [Desulfomonilaceae bacterium]
MRRWSDYTDTLEAAQLGAELSDFPDPEVHEDLLSPAAPPADLPDESVELSDAEELVANVENGVSSNARRLTYIAIVASLLLHVAVLGWFSASGAFQARPALLKPGDELTNVRLIEQPMTERRDEPAPEHARAISDRNHTAAVEKIPKTLPAPKAPLGQMDMQQQKLAALMPPAAPDIKPPLNDESKKQTPKKKELEPEKNATAPKIPRQSLHRPQKPQKQQRPLAPDLNPTQRETEIATGAAPYAGSPDFFPDGDVDEAVVDINTREEKFFSYLLYLKNKIQGVWVYPSSAANAGIGGSLTVEFSIARNGELLSVNLIDSSGHAILDESAIRAIKVAAPYYPFPSRMRAKRLRIRANFVYITSSYFRRIL